MDISGHFQFILSYLLFRPRMHSNDHDTIYHRRGMKNNAVSLRRLVHQLRQSISYEQPPP
jgi:hypothetical protein